MSTYKDTLSKFLPNLKSLEDFATSESGKALIHSFDRVLIWLRLFGRVYQNQPGEILLASANSKIIEVWGLVPLRLVHSASGSLRTIMDLVFSFSYYVNHQKEWNAICVGQSEWEGRSRILEWHIRFTPFFKEYNKQFGTLAMLDELNKDLSCFIHGIPTKGLPMIRSLDREELDKIDVAQVIILASRVDRAINSFLVGIFYNLLPGLSLNDYKTVLMGIDKTKLADCGIAVPSP
jgi:hypothetical protein